MSHWYCKICRDRKEPEHVTFEENCEDCGTEVDWIECEDSVLKSIMLEELMTFMKDHKITFVRSASSNHELVLSHQTDEGFVDYIFEEECDDTDILYKRYTKLNHSKNSNSSTKE